MPDESWAGQGGFVAVEEGVQMCLTTWDTVGTPDPSCEGCLFSFMVQRGPAHVELDDGCDSYDVSADELGDRSEGVGYADGIVYLLTEDGWAAIGEAYYEVETGFFEYGIIEMLD